MNLAILDGQPWATVALPLDYPPSRDWRSRWTQDKPIGPLMEACVAGRDRFADLICAMSDCAVGAAGVLPAFSEATLPAPAWTGMPYTAFDALVLYTLIQRHTPRRYVEIGSGGTTCMARLAAKNAGLDMHITSIDPAPRAQIDAICDTVIRKGLETADLSVFDGIGAGDVVFMDGSHRAFMNSDVTVFFIDVLPRLAPGVLVHLHDICLPWDYPDDLRPWHWNEAYMLAVYLMGRMDRIEIVAPTTFMRRDALLAALPAKPFPQIPEPDGWLYGGAFWFTHTG